MVLDADRRKMWRNIAVTVISAFLIAVGGGVVAIAQGANESHKLSRANTQAISDLTKANADLTLVVYDHIEVSDSKAASAQAAMSDIQRSNALIYEAITQKPLPEFEEE